MKTKTHSGLIRIGPDTLPMWDNLRMVVERLNAETKERFKLRYYGGRITDSALLDIAADVALATLDPEHVKRNPWPDHRASDGMGMATNDELTDELFDLEVRMRDVREALSERWRFTEPRDAGNE